MSAPAVQNPPAANGESKSAKKKKAKAAAAAAASNPVARVDSPAPGSEAADKNGDETPYMRDLQKNIRNINKKLANTAKTDAVVAAHPDKSLDELVAKKLINADQKAQIEKKPQLNAQIAQLEEQIKAIQAIQQDFRSKYETDKAALEAAFAEKLEREKSAAVKEVQDKLEAETKNSARENLLTISQFLRIAAARRSEEADPQLDENRAIEGVLLEIYGGNSSAVDCMKKLVNGSEEPCTSVNDDLTTATFAQIKAAAQEYSKDLEAEEQPVNETNPPATDPTVANATLTEMRAGDDTALTNGHPEEQNSAVPANAEASNTGNAAGANWDNTAQSNSADSAEWVQVPRDPAETETGLDATPAATSNIQSWADEQADAPPAEPAAPADPNDGFHQVQRNRNRNNERSGGQNTNGRGRGRGRGGDGRNRGRGNGGRGNGGGQRGPRRNEES